MSGDPDEKAAGTRNDRLTRHERVARTLTFWFRPAFVLKVFTRFQRMAGFDRAIALASSALTALIPIVIVVGAILPTSEDITVAKHIIHRYQLTGAGAEAVRDALAPATGATTSINVLGAILVIVASLSFSRGVQRLFEQAWELKPLSVRNSINDLIWLGGVLLYLGVSWWVHHLIDTGRIELAANLVMMPFSMVLFAWSGRILSAGRIGWRALAPFAVTCAVALVAILSFAAVYLPRLFSSYAARYGVIGAVLAMVSALFIVMVVVVATAAVGREISDEFERIGRGERPPDDEVRQEWDTLIKEASVRAETWRVTVKRWRENPMKGIRRAPQSRDQSAASQPNRRTPPE
jgi:uncharacterized BrkB/YihY/UPF0761 family membrane protein